MADIIQIRRDTAANFTAANPVLAQGEPALEIDTLNEKIGDGVTDWVTLGYRIGGGIKINGNNGVLLKKPGNSNATQIEVGDVIEVFADATTVVKAKYTNALADADTNNLGITPTWNTGNYTPISIQDLT